MPIDLFRSLRPLQWTKNLLVFVPLMFAIDLAWSVESPDPVPQLLLRLIGLFAAFCAVSSGVYLLNDLMDRESDRSHPAKRDRPIASGKVSAPVAGTAMALLAGAGLAGVWLLGFSLGVIGVFYVAINVAYSLGGKQVVLLDVMAVASGYVIRAAAGALAIDVEPSPWLFATTGAAALFIVFGRRYAEVRLAGDDGAGQRAVLERYSGPLVTQLLTISATAALLSYTLYTIEADNLPSNNTMLITLPLVVFGLFRYLYLLNTSVRAEAPEQLIVGDLPLLLSIIAWVAVSAAILVTQ